MKNWTYKCLLSLIRKVHIRSDDVVSVDQIKS